MVQITNGGSAGAIGTSGWDVVTGDAFTTVASDKFLVFMVKFGTVSWLNIIAGQ